MKKLFFGEPWRDEHHLRPTLGACLMSEFFCTTFFVFLGTSYNAVDILTGGTFGPAVPIAWGLCLIFTVQLGFRISGSHVNPAVSLFFFVFRELSFQRFLLYSVAQTSGAFIGAGLTYAVYYDYIDHYEHGDRTVTGATRTAHIFATYPQDYLTVRGGLVDQISTTAMLCICIRCITKRRHGIPLWFQPFLLGLSLSVLAVAFATNCQCAINPARDLGPRLFTLCVGYGWDVFSYWNYKWFWVPIIGPCIGAIMGGLLYKYFIGNFLSDLPEDKENPKNWFKNFRKLSTSKKFSRMAETLAKKFHLNVNNIENELVSETICRKRFASLVPGSEISQDIQKQRGSDMIHGRRRSLSPFTLSIVANYVNHKPTTLANTAAIGAQSRLIANSENFVRRRSCTPTRRRFHSIPGKPNGGTLSTIEDKIESKPPQKPPTILVYTANDNQLFKRIFDSLIKILPGNTYTVFHLSTKALISEPWIDENAVCVLLADTKTLGDLAWSRLQNYFIHSGKIIFLCQNSLLANLTNCNSAKKQANLLKNAFGNKNASVSLGKDFEIFLKKSLNSLSKNKQVNETFHAKDLVGGYKYSVVFHKKPETPLLLYMENSQNNASALFSDATADELLAGGGTSLIADAMRRLGIQLIDDQEIPNLTQGYFMCELDRLTWNMEGLKYGEEIGANPKLYFESNDISKNENFSKISNSILPIEVRKRKLGFPNFVKFNTEEYYNFLKTKSLGKAIVFIPVCETTMKISKSLLTAIPKYDGILVIAGRQTNGNGRSGNQWLSPEGCAMFSFSFNIPLNSILGQSASFVQHILAVSMVDAVISILKMNDFSLKIKWPNDLYFNRLFKMGGILVTSSISGEMLHCVIGAGLNVANSKPTVCLNDMLPEDSDKILTVEEVIAETMNKFEHYVYLFENNGKEAFLKKYYDFWLHTREEVTILNGDTGAKEKVIIRGLDTYGFLEVRSKQTGKLFSVYDNGNTFDMMKGLIRPKNRVQS